jgi:diguanylate cyclase (GGDEF)-like protein
MTGPETGGLDHRLQQIIDTIQEFAGLNFEARAEIGPGGDLVDAVAAGVNFLGEELEAAFAEIESRVAARTAELALATEELRRLALHDELTGLPNRTLLWDRLTHRLSSDSRRTTGFAVLFVDVDKFKHINDTLGHAIGDQLLQDFASRLTSSLREGDTAGRVGGDEFVVLLDEVATPAEAVSIAERLAQSLSEPYTVGAHRLAITASIGIAVSGEHHWTADSIIAAADSAMYEAKSSRHQRWAQFDQGD